MRRSGARAWVNATSASSVRAGARPSSIASRAARCPASQVARDAAHAERRARVQDHGVAARPGLAVEDGADDGGVGGGVAAAAGRRGAAARCRTRAGSSVDSSTSPSRTSATRFSPVGRQLVQAAGAVHDQRVLGAERGQHAARSARPGSRRTRPSPARRAPAGLVSGPSRLKTVRTPSSRRTGPAWRMAGWWAWREHEAEADLVDAVGDVLGRAGRCARPAPPARRPSRSFDDTARLPCLATCAPAAAATSAADVEMLKVWAPSPPVPQVSTRSSRCGRAGVTCARIARAQPVISSTVSPFMRSADQEAGDLGGRGLAAHHLHHRRVRLLGQRSLPLDQRRDRSVDHARRPHRQEVLDQRAAVRRQHRLRVELDAVRRRSRWRTPITSPSGVRAVTPARRAPRARPASGSGRPRTGSAARRRAGRSRG